MDFEKYLQLTQNKIKLHLREFIEIKKTEKAPKLFSDRKYFESLEEFVSRGKLLRGSLFILMTEGFGGKVDKKTLDIACAIELTHSALLIQDDIIDKDNLRRGEKTIHVKYKDIGEDEKASDPYHYGMSSAVVISDLAFFLAFELLANCGGEIVIKIVKYYSKEIQNVILAEGVDSAFGLTDKKASLQDIEDVYLYKTARYTFSLPFELAVIFTKGPDDARKLMGKLGELMGMVFQIKDDEMGFHGDEKEIGKPVGSDIREDKKTIIRHYLFESSTIKIKEELEGIFGNQQIGLEEVLRVRDIYKELLVQESIDKEIKKYMDQAWEIYEEIKLKNGYKKILKEFLEFNVNRSS